MELWELCGVKPRVAFGIVVAMIKVIAMLVTLSSVAYANPAADANNAFIAFVDKAEKGDKGDVALFVTPFGNPDATPGKDALADLAKLSPGVAKVSATVVSSSGKSAWVVADIPAKWPVDGKSKSGTLRASAVLIADDKGWHVRATHWSVPQPNVKAGMCGALGYEWALDKSVGDGTRDTVNAIYAALSTGKPAELVKLFSDDKRALAIGTAPGEKWIGASIKGVFNSFKLGASFHDGDNVPARSELAPDGQLMWIAMGVLAPQEFCTEYRTLFVLAKEGSEWRIVHQHYSERIHDIP